jgi:guanylate kinase
LIHDPILIVISSPSGAGKSTVCKKILASDPSIQMSISATTRKARKDEINKEHYHIIYKKTFIKKIEGNEFIEYAEVFDNLYGSLKSDVEKLTLSNKDVLFDIDWQGTQQLYQSKPNNLVSIFILPPSRNEIENRLKQRQTESGDDQSIIDHRMSKFKDELSHWVEYDYVVTNKNLEECTCEVLNIINCERKKRHRQNDLINKVRELTL